MIVTTITDSDLARALLDLPLPEGVTSQITFKAGRPTLRFLVQDTDTATQEALTLLIQTQRKGC